MATPGQKIATDIQNTQQKNPVNGKKAVYQHAWIRKELLYKDMLDATVALLASISDKKINSPEHFKATVDCLDEAGVRGVFVLVGGMLKRFNFWDLPEYKKWLNSTKETVPKLSTLNKKLDEAAQIWESEWLNENADALLQLKNKIEAIQDADKKFAEETTRNKTPGFVGTDIVPAFYELLTWKKFKEKPNYRKIYERLVKDYHEDLEFHKIVNEEVDAQVNKLLKKKKIRPEHQEAARQNKLNYMLEEMPMLSSELLPSDYLIYPEAMNKALNAAYKRLNLNIKSHRWLVPNYSSAEECIHGFSYRIKHPEGLAGSAAKNISPPIPIPTKQTTVIAQSNKQTRAAQTQQTLLTLAVAIPTLSSSPPTDSMSPPSNNASPLDEKVAADCPAVDDKDSLDFRLPPTTHSVTIQKRKVKPLLNVPKVDKELEKTKADTLYSPPSLRSSRTQLHSSASQKARATTRSPSPGIPKIPISPSIISPATTLPSPTQPSQNRGLTHLFQLRREQYQRAQAKLAEAPPKISTRSFPPTSSIPAHKQTAEEQYPAVKTNPASTSARSNSNSSRTISTEPKPAPVIYSSTQPPSANLMLGLSGSKMHLAEKPKRRSNPNLPTPTPPVNITLT